MTHYLSWAASSLQSVKATGGRLFLDKNAELVYSFQPGRITAYSIAGLDPTGLGTPSTVYRRAMFDVVQQVSVASNRNLCCACL